MEEFNYFFHTYNIKLAMHFNLLANKFFFHITYPIIAVVLLCKSVISFLIEQTLKTR